MEITNCFSNYHAAYYEKLHSVAVTIGGNFVLVSILLSTVLIFQHLRSYTRPEEQKWIIGVLSMVPMYATESIISLWNAKFSIICDILRNCYEAFALYCFGNYLVACLGGEESVLQLLDNGAWKHLSEPLLEGKDMEEAPGSNLWHDFFLNPSVVGKRFFVIVKFGIVQYGVGIALLCHFEVLPNKKVVQNGIQDFLICIEMSIAAVAHVFVFSATPYRFLPVYELGKVITQAAMAKVEVEGNDEKKLSAVEQTETHVEAPGTSITESIQDVVIGGGENVVKDVVLTISQAVMPVEKGVTKMQETFHHIKIRSKDDEGGAEVDLEEEVEEDIIRRGQTVIASENHDQVEHSGNS